jgi:WD domain, G-beta repeat
MAKPGVDPTFGISSEDVLIPTEQHPACRRRDARPGSGVAGENLAGEAIGAKRPGDAILLQVLSIGKERRISVTLAERPKIQAVQDQGGPLLMLDTGGHMALIKGLAFTPDGKQLVSAGDDKVMRVWDWQAGKTTRTIRGQLGAGNEGKIDAVALSPDAHWLAAGGLMAPGFGVRDDEVGSIRLYDFASGQLVALLKGHTNTIDALAFSPNGKRLISGGHDKSAIIWDVDFRKLLHRLSRNPRGCIHARWAARSDRQL